MYYLQTKEQIEDLLEEYGLPYSFSHFSEATVPPFIVWVSPQTSNFDADNSVYFAVSSFELELYSRVDIPDEEAKLEAFLTSKGIMWDKISQTWVDEEKVMMTVYEVS